MVAIHIFIRYVQMSPSMLMTPLHSSMFRKLRIRDTTSSPSNPSNSFWAGVVPLQTSKRSFNVPLARIQHAERSTAAGYVEASGVLHLPQDLPYLI